MFKRRLYIFIPYALFFISSIFLVLDAGINRHWSSVTDQDLVLVYNSLALRSNIYNDYVDHPGYSTILIISLWWDFLNILNISNIGDIEQLSKSLYLKNEFQNLFVYARIINILLIFFLISVIFKISYHITKNKIGSCILTLALAFSLTVIEVAGQLRTELLSSVCLFSFFYFLLKFSENQSKFRTKLIFAGIVFILGIFSKMQFFFVVIFFPIMLFYFFKQKKDNLEFFFFENKKIIIILNIIFFLVIGLMWNRYAQGILNKLFIPLVLIYFFIICAVFKFYFSIPFRSLNVYMAYFFGGQGLTVIFFYLYKKFNMWNVIVLVNFPGWITRYAGGGITTTNPLDPHIHDYARLLTKHFGNYLNFFNQYFLNTLSFEFILFFFYLFILFKISLQNKFKINKIISFFVYFLAFLIISFIFSFRPNPFYLIYLTPVIFIGLCVTASSDRFFKNKKQFVLMSFIIFTYSLINFNERKSYEYEHWNFACGNPDTISSMWLNKMDPGIYRQICNFKID